MWTNLYSAMGLKLPFPEAPSLGTGAQYVIDGTGSKCVALHRQKQSNASGSYQAHEQFPILLWGLDEMGRVGGTYDGSLKSWKSSRGVALQ